MQKTIEVCDRCGKEGVVIVATLHIHNDTPQEICQRCVDEFFIVMSTDSFREEEKEQQQRERIKREEEEKEEAERIKREEKEEAERIKREVVPHPSLSTVIVVGLLEMGIFIFICVSTLIGLYYR